MPGYTSAWVVGRIAPGITLGSLCLAAHRAGRSARLHVGCAGAAVAPACAARRGVRGRRGGCSAGRGEGRSVPPPSGRPLPPDQTARKPYPHPLFSPAAMFKKLKQKISEEQVLPRGAAGRGSSLSPQRDLDRLEHWAITNSMKLNKTNQMLDSAPGWSNLRHKSELGEEQLKSSPVERGLRVLVGRKLNGISSLCALAAKGANVILGCIKHSITSQLREVPSKSPPSTGNRIRTTSFTDQNHEGTLTPDKELLAGMIAEPAFLSEYTIFALDPTKQPKPQSDGVNLNKQPLAGSTENNGSEPVSPQQSESQSFAQKLQLRVPSMESLFQSPVKETLLHSSSKESLVRSTSRDSLNRLDLEAFSPTFDSPSDIESETEDPLGNMNTFSKEQLLQRLCRMERSLGNYRGKYSELVSAYQVIQREKKKLQSILSQSQDKALRRIGELREELQMDQQAKKHLQEEFDASIEEKDQLISVLQTQVSLLKQRLQNGQMGTELPDQNVQSEPQVQSPMKEVSAENIVETGSNEDNEDSVKTLETLNQRVKHQENLLQRCKETIRSHKECCAQLTNEKEALQEQLEERLQELEKMKDLHMAEKTKLITQLRDAKNLIEQLEQDKGMVIAETKRQMHETLEMKEEEVAQLRARIKQITTKGEELKEQKEKSERDAFEELEKAVSIAQKTEEARKKLQTEMDEKIKAVEKASEEERVNLQRELTRVKEEVVEIMKKSSEERVAELEKIHKKELATKDQELNERLQAQEKVFQEKMKAALEKNQSECLNVLQEQEQQESLALEELELQKKAIQSECDKKVEKMHQEVETCRTRILELESSLAKYLQDDRKQSEELNTLLESAKKQHSKEINDMVEKHSKELENVKQQQEKIWTEKLEILKQQQITEIEKIREKQQQEIQTILKEKETIFCAHIEEMNEKTLEKLDVKQIELEALSSELSEALKIRHDLEQELSELNSKVCEAKQELKGKLEEERKWHNEVIETMLKEHEMSIQVVEKVLKEELNKLKQSLEEKDRHLEELRAHERKMKESAERSKAELVQVSAKLEEQSNEYMKKVTTLTQQYECQLKDLQRKADEMKRSLTEKENEMEHMKKLQNKQVEELKQKLLAAEERISTLQGEYESKLKYQEKKVEKMKQKSKDMQETFKNKLAEQEAKLKKELENKQLEFSQKESEFHTKIFEMAHASSSGINDAVSKLESNQKEQLESFAEDHIRKLEEVVQSWEKKLNQQIEELKDQHAMELQEKEQEVGDLKQKLFIFSAEKEDSRTEIIQLKEERMKREECLKELQEQLKQSVAKMNALSDKESDMKTQLKKLESDLKQSLKQQTGLQEQLNKQKTVEEKDKATITELAGTLRTLEGKLQTVQSSQYKDHENYDQRTETIQLKETEFKRLSGELTAQLDAWKNAEALLQTKGNELIEKCSGKIGIITCKIADCERQTAKVKEAILIKTSKITELEAKLREITEHHSADGISLQKSMQELQKKDNLIMSMRADIAGLVTENEQLQKEGGHQQQAASEKETCITQLRKELSENINAVTSMREELQEKQSEVSALNKTVTDLNVRLESTVSLTEKEAAISLLSKQHQEDRLQLLNQVEELSSRVEMLSQEKASALDQIDHCMAQLSEWKMKAQTRFTQNHDTIKDLQSKLELSNTEANKKVEELNKLKEQLAKQNKNLDCLKSELEQKQNRREKEENELTSKLKKQAAKLAELEKDIAQKTLENDSLLEELKKCNEQKHTEKEEIAWQLHQAEKVAFEKENRFKKAEEKVLNLEKQISSLKADFEAKEKEFDQMKSVILKRKEEELKELEERLNAENSTKLADLKKKAEQKIHCIRKQLLSQMEEKEQQFKQDREDQLQKLEQKVQEREAKIESLEEKIKSTRDSTELEKDMLEKLESLKAAVEQEKNNLLESVQQAYKEKMQVLQKGLTEKDALLQKYEKEQRESNDCHLELQNKQKELLKKLECIEKSRQEEQGRTKILRKELEEQTKKYSLLVDEHACCGNVLTSSMEELKVKEQKNLDMENIIGDLQKKMQEKEAVNQSLEQKIKELENNIVKENEMLKIEMEDMTLRYEEKLKCLQQQLGERNDSPKAFEENAEEKCRSVLELQKLLADMQNQKKDLQTKLEETEGEKQKLYKEVNRLQKDIRALRKEHQQELDIVKKESLEDMEQKIRYEQEDIELKHNSTLKQLIREFNTQLAQKERELETTVKETISKAQEVENELIENHHIEITQLHKKIVEKDDDLKRTVKKYEEILESREEEMTAKVHELQAQLEDLQKEYKQRIAEEEHCNTENVTITELKALLAQKTTLVSDSKLKEQELKEQIHVLEDQLKHEKNLYVTSVGTSYRDGNLHHNDVSLFEEPTEIEYLRKVLFEYMMGRETKTMAKVITAVLKFPADQTQKILEREDTRPVFWLRPS
ncbi:golgin subfamily A member 4 isoform X3 [Vidua chalybeata]|uniref:golgin subfamily A member 4 isoform X3 n=1 Tax=Vidua chalybeata TaxID=81927 RepID=UPI0023A7E8C1|nr:golgin subfamily A member 4 isoform X3 [Vidua chalybeata]